MLTKVLVANRGEIAVRAFRAAYELDITTVAVYAHEDRGSGHRAKADEAWEVGERGRPVRAYLDIDALVDLARRTGSDAIYPGYGFLSESAPFARACAQAGVTFVGPPADVLELTGDKLSARRLAEEAGLPVLAGSDPLDDLDAAVAAAEAIGFPIFVKAAAGGGGRGLRLVERPGDLRAAVETAMREAEAAFGDGRVFLEQAVVRPRHVEVQVLADATGEVIHLHERDCSVQRRHQKVIEIAPAPALDDEVRAALHTDAVAFAKAAGYVNAGTVEFLVGEDGRHVFIEMNPRIQVEHTVTEEVTGVDLVSAQLRIAGGASLADLGLTQDAIDVRGTAIQCRITTEDPANAFRPDTGRITAYRSPGGAGIRLDGGAVYAGAEISPYFDSMIVKLTSRGPDLTKAAARSRRALAEFRVRGVRTNTGFLRAVLDDPDFLAGRATTSFIDERPHLTQASAGQDRASKLLDLLADRTVNRPDGARPTTIIPRTKLPEPPQGDPPTGSRQLLDEVGPVEWAARLRAQTALAVTDTTFRDAHQSLLATRVRTTDLVAAAPHIAHGLPGLLSAEVWGGATFDVALRFLHEDPWDRLAQLREAMPNVCLQMLLRGRNVLGYGTYPDRVVTAFVAEARRTGIDVFRIFDALNSVERMVPGITAVLEAGGVAEGAICYTGDLSDPRETTYTLDHYLGVAEGLIDAGVHVLCIKDMAGLLRAPAARTLVTALRERFDAPVHLHTHDTAGGQLGTYVAAAEAGVDAVDGAAAAWSGMTSQPSLSAVAAAFAGTDRDTGLDLAALSSMEPYFEAVRAMYTPFEAGLKGPTGSVYRHQIPGGQLSNLRQQAVGLGLGDRFEEIEDRYARCNDVLGDLIKVTPTSKVVGDLALALLSADIDPEVWADDPSGVDLPDSVLDFLRGDLGRPVGGWPEPLRTKVLGADASDEPPAPDPLSAQDEAALDGDDPRGALSRIMFPGPAADFEASRQTHGDVSVVPTRAFLYGLEQGEELEVDLAPGVRLICELEAVGEPDDTGLRTVVIALNGQPRPVEALDRSVESSVTRAERANPAEPGHVAAALTGVATPSVAVGDTVAAGDAVAVLEAMKMESTVTTPVAGTVERVAVGPGTNVEPGDLLVVIAPA